MKTKHIVRIFIFSSLLPFISGCVASGPQFKPVESFSVDNALVYLYRPNKFKGGGIVPPVFVNDKELFDLPNDGYAEILLPPGKHVIETRTDGNFLISDAVGSAEIEVEVGRTYYIKWLPFLADFGIVPLATPVAYGYFKGTFYPMDEQHALVELKECKKVYPK